MEGESKCEVPRSEPVPGVCVEDEEDGTPETRGIPYEGEKDVYIRVRSEGGSSEEGRIRRRRPTKMSRS